jgi:hypothetical protein
MRCDVPEKNRQVEIIGGATSIVDHLHAACQRVAVAALFLS